MICSLPFSKQSFRFPPRSHRRDLWRERVRIWTLTLHIGTIISNNMVWNEAKLNQFNNSSPSNIAFIRFGAIFTLLSVGQFIHGWPIVGPYSYMIQSQQTHNVFATLHQSYSLVMLEKNVAAKFVERCV